MKHLIISVCAAAVLAACSGDKNSQNQGAEPAQTETQTEVVQAADLPKTADGKFIVTTASDLPSPKFETKSSAEPLIYEDHPDYPKMITFLETELENIEANYDIQDKTTRDALVLHHKTLAVEREDWDEALRLSQVIRDNEADESLKAVMFYSTDSFMKAVRDTGTDTGAEFERAYRTNLDTVLQAMDMTLVRKRMKQFYRQAQLTSPERTRNAVKTDLGMVGAFTNFISYADARTIAAVRFRVRIQMQNAILKDALKAYVENIPQPEVLDYWSERLVDVKSGEPVTVAIWDTGVDADVMGERMWTRPETETRGNAHGLAFGPRYLPEEGELQTVPESFAAIQDEQLTLIKGSLDLEAGMDTPEADAYFDYLADMDPKDTAASNFRLGFFSSYIHGQHVADIAAFGNERVQIMNIRSNLTLPSYPAMRENFVKSAQDTADYMRDNNVRVVNMSWRFTYPMLAGRHISTLEETDVAGRRKETMAIFKELENGLSAAIASAPDTLFVVAAGNEDENVDFVQSIPSGLNLPNVITVGAVDSALKPASFTSFGDSIDVYANGYEVAARVPGGQVLKLSGTSMASPQVANLAAKILTQKPDLTVSELRGIIESSSTMEGKLRVIHPKAAMRKVTGED